MLWLMLCVYSRNPDIGLLKVIPLNANRCLFIAAIYRFTVNKYTINATKWNKDPPPKPRI